MDFAALPSDAEVNAFHLSAMSAYAVISFVAAYVICELLRLRFGIRFHFTVPLTCFLGSALSGAIGSVRMSTGSPSTAPLDFLPLYAMLCTVWTAPVMTGVVISGYIIVRFWAWLSVRRTTS